MKKKILKKILKLRSFTKFSLIYCKNALKRNNWDINKAIEYLREKSNNIKINDNNLKYGLVYSKINKSKNLGHIIQLNVKSEEASNNKILFKLLKKILKISINNNCKNISQILNSKINKDITIKNVLLDKSIMFKDKIIIKNFFSIKADYIYNYNHYNYKLSSLVGYNIKKKNKKINKKIIKYISLDLIGNELLNKENKIYNINKYYNNKRIDKNFLERININLKKYLYYLNNININNYNIIKLEY
ncbi:MAG: hypothetical protein NHF96_00960 [Candidatus Shikimatogenerans bostrichidophilus]|nr:MAG: hypothetical protein NHF96_00960 [Candidatus Shikimatogenerans bostrichidophilus]